METENWKLFLCKQDEKRFTENIYMKPPGTLVALWKWAMDHGAYYDCQKPSDAYL